MTTRKLEDIFNATLADFQAKVAEPWNTPLERKCLNLAAQALADAFQIALLRLEGEENEYQAQQWENGKYEPDPSDLEWETREWGYYEEMA